MTRKCMLLGFLALAGCAGPAVKAEPSEPSLVGRSEAGLPPPFVISLSVKTASKDSAGWQKIAQSTTLSSGTEFALYITAGTAVFIYVGQHPAGADVSLIYPAGDGQGARAEPNHPAYLPASGQWFQLDNHPGKEAFLILASTKPQDAATAKRLMSERGDAVCATVRDPPPDIPVRDRGEAVTATLDADGLAVLCFPFLHD